MNLKLNVEIGQLMAYYWKKDALQVKCCGLRGAISILGIFVLAVTVLETIYRGTVLNDLDWLFYAGGCLISEKETHDVT